MNIFTTDVSPIRSAINMCDKHIGGKMLVESAQMLANCFEPEVLAFAPKTKKGKIRKYSYFNHPCSIWVRESFDNFSWLCEHSIAMEEERLARNFNPHFSIAFVNWAMENINNTYIEKGGLTNFPIAISEDKNCRKVEGFECLDRIRQYRLYYKLDKPFATWKKNRPDWMDWEVDRICA